MFERILVALDGSKTSDAGLRAALELAVAHRASLYALHVVDDAALVPSVDAAYLPSAYLDRYYEGIREQGRSTLAKAEALARSCGAACTPLLVETMGESIAHTILRQARKVHAHVIVLGTHGRRGLRRALMGSDAEEVVREANVPVLLVRKAAPAPRARRKPAPSASSARTSPAGRRMQAH